MTDDEPLEKADYDSVYAAMAAMKAQGLGGGTLNGSVEAWEQLIEEVEEGYDWDSSEYFNELAVRSWLERVKPILTPRVRASLESRLAPLDERFRAATTDRVVGSEWWFRLPKLMVGRMAESYPTRASDAARRE